MKKRKNKGQRRHFNNKEVSKIERVATIFQFSSIIRHLSWSGAGPGLASEPLTLRRVRADRADRGSLHKLNSRGVTQPTLGLRKRLAGGE